MSKKLKSLIKTFTGIALSFILLSATVFQSLTQISIKGFQTSQSNPSPPMISAHRGASKLAPENTLAAYALAMEMGADFIEIDIRTTLDGELISLHDGSLKRTTGYDRLVKDCTLKEIRELRANKGFESKYRNEKIPTVKEICQLVSAWNKKHSKQVGLYVDCKDIKIQETINLLSHYHLLETSVFYGDINKLISIRKISPIAKLLPPYPGLTQMDRVIEKIHPFAFDVPWSQLTPEIMALCKTKNIYVFSDLLGEYDNPSEYRKAIELGISVIQTDDIEHVKITIHGYKK